MSITGGVLWHRTTSQSQSLLVIGLLALVLTLGVAGSLLAGLPVSSRPVDVPSVSSRLTNTPSDGTINVATKT